MRTAFSLLAAAMLLAGGAAWAQNARIGLVDVQKVESSYQEFQAKKQEYQQFRQQELNKLHQQMVVAMLSEQDAKEYQGLLGLAAPTDAQKTRIAELEKAAAAAEQEMDSLGNSRQPLTDDQTKRLKELQAKAAAVDSSRDQVDGRLKSKYQELSDKLTANVKKAIEQVAKQEKLTVVLFKDQVLYGGQDVTDKVIEVLNKPAA